MVFVKLFRNRIWSTATIDSNRVTTSVSSSSSSGTESGVVGTCNKDPCVYAGFLSEESLIITSLNNNNKKQVKIHKNTHPREGIKRAETSDGGGS